MKISFGFFLVLMSFASSASAGPFNDTMSVCLVKSSTDADKTLLMRWIFAAMATHPQVKDLANISAKQAGQLNKDTSKLFMDLLTVRCIAETKDALKYEGSSALTSSFEVLGKVAMQGLMADEQVSKYMAGMGTHLDEKALQALMPVPAAEKNEKK